MWGEFVLAEAPQLFDCGASVISLLLLAFFARAVRGHEHRCERDEVECSDDASN